MDGLRWLLLFFGLLVIAGVYWYSRRERDRSSSDSLEHRRLAPTMGDEDGDDGEDDAEAVAPEASTHGGHEPVVPQKIVTLRLVARNGGAFKGDELILSMRGIGLRHGKFGIFHRIDGDDENRMIFSAASLIEPGSFDLANIKEQEIPGISLFMVLPGPIDAVEAFDMMMETARALAQSLQGELLDETGSTLSIQRERYMREEVIQYQHSHLVA
jgi:cell division protein ZipA